MKFIQRFARARQGAAVIEYAILAGSIGVALIFALQVLGVNLAATFWTLADTIGAALNRS